MVAVSRKVGAATNKSFHSLSRSFFAAMHLLTVTSILVATASLCHSQVTAVNANKPNHWCGQWAGSPRLEDRPRSQQLPPFDYTRRFFVEPQLLNTPFAPIMASEPKVQVPKIWGNSMSHHLTYHIPLF